MSNFKLSFFFSCVPSSKTTQQAVLARICAVHPGKRVKPCKTKLAKPVGFDLRPGPKLRYDRTWQHINQPGCGAVEFNYFFSPRGSFGGDVTSYRDIKGNWPVLSPNPAQNVAKRVWLLGTGRRLEGGAQFLILKILFVRETSWLLFGWIDMNEEFGTGKHSWKKSCLSVFDGRNNWIVQLI